MENAQYEIEQLWKELNKLKDKVNGMNFPSLDDFKALKQRVDKLESSNAALKKAFGDLQKEINELKKLKSPESGANQEQVDRLEDELAKLRAEFEQHRDYAQKHIMDLVNQMPHKADKQDLIDLENRLLD